MLIRRLTLLLCMAYISAIIYAQNVGIGTLTPAFRLDLVGRARIQASTLNNASTSSGIWHTDYRDNSNIVFAGMRDSVNYGFYGNRSGIGWQMFFDARYGNVGIGRLPLSGTVRLALDHPSGASLNVYSNGDFSGGFQATDTTLEIFSRNGYRSGLVVTSQAKDIIFWPPCTSRCVVGEFSGRVGMYVNTPNARLHIAASTGASGVLIGSSTLTPATGYMLSVGGKIICEELKVQLNGSWPDYVFEKDYALTPLEQVEQEVMSNKHLPGIPSATEVGNQNGVEVGDLQKKMLEKIEELYRYVFEVNKENKALKEKIATLENSLRK